MYICNSMSTKLDKVKLFVNGHRRLMEKIEKACASHERIMWVHSASYGEFEEVKPIVKAIQAKEPDTRVLVTFFSPSGYEYHKDDLSLDMVFYLPLATRSNARRFLDAVKPCRIIISISDYWPPFLFEAARRNIPCFLTSARFEPEMVYFKPWGSLYRRIFRKCFTRIFVRDSRSLALLRGIGVENVRIAGDPRMDRVLEISSAPWTNGIVEKWSGGEKVFVAGSITDENDERLVLDLVNSHPAGKFLAVPHEIEPEKIRQFRERARCKSVLYSEAVAGASTAGCPLMILDTVGMLAQIYRYGFASYVGSGFCEGGPHSLLEPASYGIPVVYGPVFGSYHHCQAMMDCGAGFSVSDGAQLCELYDRMLADEAFLKKAGDSARQYCIDGSGVAGKLADSIIAAGGEIIR